MIPDEYQRIEYLVTKENAYISNFYQIHGEFKLEIKTGIQDDTTYPTTTVRLLGYRNVLNNLSIINYSFYNPIDYNYDRLSIEVGTNGKYTSYTFRDDLNSHRSDIIEYLSDGIIANGIKYDAESLYDFSYLEGKNFRFNGETNFGYSSHNLRVYYVRFTSLTTNTITNNFLPVKRKLDSKVGFYDTINNKFVYSETGYNFGES